MGMTPEKAIEARDMGVQQLAAEQKTFMNILRAMPDDRIGYRPDERIMEFGQLARHVAGSGSFFVGVIEAGHTPEPEERETPPLPTSIDELASEVEETFQKTLEAFKSLNGEQLSRPIDFYGMGEHPGVGFLNWDMVHLVHHRAQMGLYLRLAGQKVPSIYGPTLDVTFEDMMQAE